MAINKAGKTDPRRSAPPSSPCKGHQGAEGEYNFDENGDGLHGYNVVKNDKGNMAFEKRIDFKE